MSMTDGMKESTSTTLSFQISHWDLPAAAVQGITERCCSGRDCRIKGWQPRDCPYTFEVSRSFSRDWQDHDKNFDTYKLKEARESMEALKKEIEAALERYRDWLFFQMLGSQGKDQGAS